MTASCPICHAPITGTVSAPLIREMHLHVLRDHFEELRRRVGIPSDPVIAELEEYDIYLNRRDLDRLAGVAKPRRRR